MNMTDNLQPAQSTEVEQIRQALNAHWHASAVGDADAEHDITVDNVSLACMHVEPVSQWKGFSPGMTGMRAVYAVSLAKRGFAGPRGAFDGPKGPEQIFAQSIQVDWEDRISVPQGPGLGFAPDPSVIRTYLRA